MNRHPRPAPCFAWLAAVAATVLLFVAGPAVAAVSATFDHFTTSFELLGQHKDVACEACHVGGIFKGTPHDCASCHATGSRIGATAKPANHILSSNDCSTCHTPSGWKPVAMFNHVGMIGSCSSCHNNVQTVGKPATHIPTSLDCSSCHLPTLPWKRANFTHAGITGNCATCHNGVQAPGKPAAHLPTTEACETCHSTTNFTTWAGTSMVHTGITSGCQSCHETGMSWYGVTMVDRPTAAQDPVHPTAQQAPDCSKCHAGYAVGDFSKVKLPATHLPTAAACVQCHTTTGNYAKYVMGATGHSGITGGCATCHATGKSFLGIAPPALVEPPVGPPAHLPIPAADGCETCHSTTSFATGGFGPSTPMNHAGITNGCQACHETGMAWKGVTMVDRPTTVKDPNHPTATTSPDCSTCHSGFAVGDFNKNAKPANHIPTSAACTQCHNAIPNFAVYVMGTTGHAGISSGCATCHGSGLSFANMAPPTLVEPPANHLPIPTGDGCETCHSTTTFATGGFGPGTPMNHAGLKSGCQSCHETGMAWKGVTMVDRPTAAQDALHPTAAQGADCASCHSTTTFAAGAFNSPTVLPANHMPSSLVCTTCHTAIPAWATYAMGTAGHSGITSGCANCHASGKSFLGIAPPALVEPPVGPPAHLPIPAADGCETCHSTTSFATGGFGPSTPMNHAGITNGCQACHETGMAWKGVTMVDRPTAAQDPNHPTAATSPDCSTCHSGFAVGDFNLVAKPTGHIPTTAACSQCHTTAGNYAVYTAGATLHTGITSGCATCHATGTGPWAGVGGLTFTIKQPPSNHLPIPTGVTCETCHSTTSFATGGFGPSTPMNHAGITKGCQSCHETGMSWYGVTMVDRPTATQDPSHPTAATAPDCSTCHSGFAVGDFNMVAKPTGHIPTTAACSQCHTTAGNYAVYTAGATLHTGITSGCATCHATGTGPWAGVGGLTFTIKQPPSNHIPIGTAACEGCHSTSAFTAFSGTTIKHAPVTTETCETCHEYSMRAANYWYGIALVWHRESTTHHAGQDCKGCHNSKDGSSSCSGGTSRCGQSITVGATTAAASIKQALSLSSGTPPPASAARVPALSSMRATYAAGPPAVAHVDHATVATTSCVTCHNGRSAVGKAASHPRTSDACSACHATLAWMPVLKVDHAEVRTTCSSCHNGAAASAKPAGHVATALDCDACHTTSAWRPAAFDHAGVLSGSCISCHNGALAAAKSARHPSTRVACDTCHYTLAWTPTRPQRATARTTAPKPAAPPARTDHGKSPVPIP